MKRKLTMVVAAALIAATAVAAQPRYIFYFIGDGMGMGPVMSAISYKRQVHPEQPSLTMTGLPVASWCQTWSASSPVTDSAAAGTALSTGYKTNNSMLGVAPDTTSVTSIARYLKDAGWGVGVLTTVAPDDATPGAFYAHAPKRSQYYDIDIQAAASNYDFLAGASLRGAKDKDGNPTDVMDRLQQAGYTVVFGPDGMTKIADADKVVLLGDPACNTNNNDVSYTIDSVPGALTLPDMTNACLQHLQRVSPDRFFMMVEGGNIDHALHGNDGGAAIKEVIQFDKAIAVAYDFLLKHPDETLIVITADHDTGGMTLGNKALSYNARLQYIDSQRMSKEKFNELCKNLLQDKNVPGWADMKQILTDKFGFWTVVPVSEEKEAELQSDFNNMVNKVGQDEKTLYASFNAFAVSVFRIFNDATGLGFTTTSHTGNPVPVFAAGDGADVFKSVNNNIEIPSLIYRLATGKNLRNK